MFFVMALAVPPRTTPGKVVNSYFQAWNERDMESAVACFAEDCEYDDTQYASAFTGKEALRKHLVRVADALPESFQFVVDELAEGGPEVGVRWHLESAGKELPFTRGASMYYVEKGLIQRGFDVPEPAVFKPGDAGLNLLSTASKLIKQPWRLLPLVAFVVYCQQVFLGDALPGPNALSLDPATWSEVRDLSLNFWFVGPLVAPSFFPVRHPLLEAVFNLVLAWSALFACFAADGRRDSTFLKTVVGMQFLTNAFFLPYLVTRPIEDKPVKCSELNAVERALETQPSIPLLLGFVGVFAIGWGLFGRPEFVDRFATFQEALANDRLGSSFLVDLSSYALFQSWLIPGDLTRRKSTTDATKLLGLGCIPFFGLVGYLLARPPLEE